MDTWEFLLQRKGDKSWLPLESPAVEIMEGQYRLASRSSFAMALIAIQLKYIPSPETAYRPIQQKISKRVNPEGLLIVTPYTHFTPGSWQIGCYKVENMPDQKPWSIKIGFDVLPISAEFATEWQLPELSIAEQLQADSDNNWQITTDDADDNASANLNGASAADVVGTVITTSSDRFDMALHRDRDEEPQVSRKAPQTAQPQSTPDPVTNLVEQEVEELAQSLFGEYSPFDVEDFKAVWDDEIATPDQAALQAQSDFDIPTLPNILLCLEQPQYLVEQGEKLTIVGEAHVAGELEIILKSPQNMETILNQRSPLDQTEDNQIPIKFSCKLDIPKQQQSQVMIGEVRLHPAIDSILDAKIYVTHQAITVTYQPQDILATLAQATKEIQDFSEAEFISASQPEPSPWKTPVPVALTQLDKATVLEPPSVEPILASPPITKVATAEDLTTQGTPFKIPELPPLPPLPPLPVKADLPAPASKTKPSLPPPPSSTLTSLPKLPRLPELDQSLQPLSEAEVEISSLDDFAPDLEKIDESDPYTQLEKLPLDLHIEEPEIYYNFEEESPDDLQNTFDLDLDLDSDPDLNPNPEKEVASNPQFDPQPDEFAELKDEPEFPNSPKSEPTKIKPVLGALQLGERFFSKLHTLTSEATTERSEQNPQTPDPEKELVDITKSPELEDLAIELEQMLVQDQELNQLLSMWDDDEIASNLVNELDNEMRQASQNEANTSSSDADALNEVIASPTTPDASPDVNAVFGFPKLSAQEIVPLPTLEIPEGDVVAGTSFFAAVQLPAIEPKLFVKLWIKDCQTRTVIDGPRWLADFKKVIGTDLMEARTQITVPLGSMEIAFEAITVEMLTSRESHKTRVMRSVLPPDIDESPDTDFNSYWDS